ncbi:alpha/beta-hydrolase [Mollisia scopiformis]|uniref:Alpha/beta-hydrolase n=1 Tax=Mollisia scopiformis TaxID=149040 RepID=A0A194X0G0_MOLSC|nr:alpha/beta-hydrolase [Mollisia scopiformis]KUJ13683.1 alpha/beta-hydrolase [Mollisia scopiformis]
MLQVRFLLFSVTLLLTNIAEATYRTIKHPHNSNYEIRVKEHADGVLCNGGGKHFTGWADIGDRHLFYWYHPARHVPAKDAPLLVWLDGGPGASSTIGMLMLHGPCLLDMKNQTTRFNPDSWTEFFNVIYLDQPAGTGFSYVEESENPEAYPRRSEESALDFIVALELFRVGFEGLEHAPLYVAGESWAGQYVPTYGAAILDYNTRVSARERIPLVSVIIGNGWVSPAAQFPALYDISCFEYNGIPPVLNETECAKMAPIAARCEYLANACATFPDDIVCSAVGDYCEPTLKAAVGRLEKGHPWDRTLVCNAPTPDACYPELKGITELFAVPEVLDQLEAVQQTQGKAVPFEVVSSIIEERYSKSGGDALTSVPALTRLIDDADINVLIYVGTQDWIVNPVGVRRCLDEMRFEDYLHFRNQGREELAWKTKEGRSAGTVKKIDGLWHVELAGAGHMAPYNQPHSSLKLMEAWLVEVESRKLESGASLGNSRESEGDMRTQRYLSRVDL